MQKFDRRQLLKAAAIAGAGASAASMPALTSPATAFAAAASPTAGAGSDTRALPALAGTPGVTYQTFGGWDFHPLASTTAFSWSGTGPGYLIGTAGAFMLKSFAPPHGSTLTEVSFWVNRPDTSSADDVGFFVGVPSTPSYSFSLISVPGTGFQRVDVPFTAIPVNTTTQEFTLFMNPHGSTNRLLMGARVGWILNPGLVTFANPRRIYGDGTVLAPGQAVLHVDATKKTDLTPSGVPAGATAAFCAISSYGTGVISLYKDGDPDNGIGAWASQGTAGNGVNQGYNLVPLSAAGKFSFTNYFTNKAMYFDVWGYLV